MDYLNGLNNLNNLNNLNLKPFVRRKSFDLIEKAVSDIKMRGNKIIFVGISGGPASGTTKISNYFHIRIPKSEIIKEISFFKSDIKERNIEKENEDLTKEYANYSLKRRLFLIDICSLNSFDYDKFNDTLKTLSEGKKVDIPYFDEEKYEFIKDKYKTIDPVETPLIIVEGYYLFKDHRLKEKLNLKIYKDVEDDVRLTRLIEREEKYLNKDQKAYKMFFDIYKTFFKNSFKDNIKPNKNSANILLPDYKIVNENNEMEEDDTLEFLIQNLIKLSGTKN